MTKSKIAISIAPQLLAKAKQAVKAGKAESVSAYVATAIEQKAKLDDLAALLQQMLLESGGPLTPAERRAAEAELGIAPRRRRRGRAA